MQNTYNEMIIARLKKDSLFLSICVGVIGVLVLVGWYFDITVLKRVSPNFIAMKPNAAIAFIFISLSLIFYLNYEENKKTSVIFLARFFTVLALIIGILTLIENIAGYDLHIDQIFFQEQLGPTVFYSPGRIAPVTSLTFVIIGLSLLLQSNKYFIILSQCLIIVVGLFGITVLVGISFHSESKTIFVHYAYAAFHAAINFILISISVLFAKPKSGIMRIIMNNTIGGQVARQLTPFIIIVPVVLAYLTFHCTRTNLFDPTSGIVFFAVANIAILLMVLFWVAGILMRTDLKRKEAYAKLEKSVIDLKYANNELHQIIRISTHDLQEPLRMISSFTQLLEKRYKDKLDDDANDFINFAVEGAVRMQKELNDMLFYTHVEYNAAEYKLSDCNVLLKKALNTLDAKISAKQAEIKSDNLPAVIIDPMQITTVFTYLLDNAIKFCEQQPKIHISVTEEPTQWIFSIQDNGIGIRPEYQEQIFVLFKRLHTRDKYSGTGIGLAICKKIIEFHQGKIWVKSAEGKGSTFYFSIPK